MSPRGARDPEEDGGFCDLPTWSAAKFSTCEARHRAELRAHIDEVCREAAASAATAAVDQMMARLGIDDPDGIRAAIRMAKAFEVARDRFWGSIFAALGFAFLAALWAGYQSYMHK